MPSAQAAASPEEIQRLIRQLGAPEYRLREQAQAALARLGADAVDALGVAATHEDLEIAARARYLLQLIRINWLSADDPPEVQKLLQNYDSLSDEYKRERMAGLARMADGSGLAALCRVVRYERSPLLAKFAAVELIKRWSSGGVPREQAVAAVQRGLDRCERVAAHWLKTWSRFAVEPRAAVEEWNILLAAEEERLRLVPHDTDPALVVFLARFQVEWLKRLGQSAAATAAIRRAVDLEVRHLIEPEEDDNDPLSELLDWLVRHKEWTLIDGLAQRFQERFREDPLLLYALAQAQAESGQRERAEQTAAEALRLNPDKEPGAHHLHFMVAGQLRQRGQLAWAEREYRHVIGQAGPRYAALGHLARLALADMLHDQARHLEAAELLAAVIEGTKHLRNEEEHLFGGETVGGLRSRMHYYYACHYENARQGDKAREHLIRALEADMPDIDALIACHRASDLPPEHRQRTVAAIRKWLEALNAQIEEEPERASPYNQYAWLVGNTSQDQAELEKALAYSRKSLEISPDTGGYYDTLAHVYFAKGDYANAVAYQSKAVELEPHSGLIARQLKLFRAKLAEQQKQRKN